MVPVQIKSKERVAKHGEVLTGEREVNAMLDLVKQETERIESRFLEPACGTGNFLVEILRRKLALVTARYRRTRFEWERNAVLAVSSVYGIDILQDNVQDCRERLFALVAETHESVYRSPVRPEVGASIRYILERNIIWGDALDLTEGDQKAGQPIIFSEWSPVNGSLFKRRDFAFFELLKKGNRNEKDTARRESSLFEPERRPLVSDKGEYVFMPEPVREFPPVHFLEIGHAYE